MATAILNGLVVDDGGFPCEGRFEYGYTPAFGFATPWRNNLRTGDTFQEYVINLTGGSTVYFQAQVRNAGGVAVGLTLLFVTLRRNVIVVTDPATNVATTTATLNGTLVEDMGQSCEWRFEYGGTIGYGATTPWQSSIVSGDSFLFDIAGLSPGKSYHYRAVARNRYGTGFGNDITFNTLAEAGARSGLLAEYLLILQEH